MPAHDDTIVVVGMNRGRPAVAERLHLGKTGVVVPVLIAVGNRPVRLGKPHDLRSELQQVLELRFGGNAPALDLRCRDRNRQKQNADDRDCYAESERAEDEAISRFPVDRGGSKVRRAGTVESNTEKSKNEKQRSCW